MAEDVSSATQKVLGASEELSTAAEVQVSAVAETTATTEQIHRSGVLTNETAKAIATESDRSRVISREGLDAVETSIAEIKELQIRVGAIATGIRELRALVDEIGAINAMVNEVASQSKLLAVNASIEAAKAGEVGQGFEVVAREVTVLAARSKEATAEVARKLASSEQAIGKVVALVQAGLERSERGVRAVEDGGRVIRLLGDAITNSAASARRIEAGTEAQVNGIGQVHAAVGRIQRAAEENQQNTWRMTEISETLDNVARILLDLVANYRLNAAPGDRVESDRAESDRA